MQNSAVELLALHPEAVGRLCGFDRLRETPHGLWMREMLLGREDMTLLAHRGSYKTTCLTVVIAALLLLEPEKNILFLRKTDSDVAEVLRQVRGLLLSGPMQALSQRLYGQPLRVLRATQGELECDTHLSPRGAPQLVGQGIGGSLTGKHADLIFTDDIVNLSDRLSAPERERTRSVYQELQNIRNPGGRLINTGTPWHREDAISLMPNARRWDCRATGLLTEEQIAGLRAAMSPSLFAANYELRHVAEGDALFARYPAFTSDAGRLRDGIAHLDASYGGEDCTALTCARREGDSITLYGRLWRCHVDLAAEEILRECDRLMTWPLHLEVNGDKGYLARELRARGAAVHPYTERMNKAVKIATYLRKWWPSITFLEGTDPEYLAQIMDYTPQAAHDDAPDSAACAVRALDRGRFPPSGLTL